MIYLEKENIAYAPAPKVASTTIKHILYRIRTNTDYKPSLTKAKNVFIHDAMPTNRFKQWSLKRMMIKSRGAFIFAIVRDPLSRIRSCHANRICYFNDIEKNRSALKKIVKENLPTQPDINTFIANLDTYITCSKDIHHHASPLVDYLGKEPALYSKIYTMPLINTELFNDLQTICSSNKELFNIKKLNKRKIFDQDKITKQNIEKIHNFYSEDYRIYGSYFKDDDIDV